MTRLAIQCRHEGLTPVEMDALTGLFTRHVGAWAAQSAGFDRYLAERESLDNCSMCGRPINGEPDIDGHYWTKHPRYIDLCDNCGDDEESEK